MGCQALWLVGREEVSLVSSVRVMGKFIYLEGCIYKYEKHFPKMLRDVGMAVPKTTETRCRDGSVQARQVIKRLHKQPHPYIFLLL